MLDRNVVEEFLEGGLRERRIKRPKNISRDYLLEAFCKYVEDDYYEWLKDNFKSFFNNGQPDWRWIAGRIQYYAKQ